MGTHGGEQERSSWTGRAKPPPASSRPDPTLQIPITPPRRRRRPGLAMFLVVLAVFGVLCAGGAYLAFSLSGGPAEGKSVAGSAPPGLNTAVRDGKLEFVITSVTCGHDSVGRRIVAQKPQGQFCIVSLTVKNIGTEAVPFSDLFQKAIGPGDEVYGADTGAGVAANESGRSVWTVINPGNQVSGKIVFDIPKDAEITKLVLHDTPLSGGVTVVLPPPKPR